MLRTTTFEKSFFGVLTENDILSDFFMRMLYGSATHPYLYFHMDRDDELFNFVGYAYNEFQNKRQYKKRMLNSIIDAFFITLLRNHSQHVMTPDDEIPEKEDNAIFILKYMQDNFMTVSISELSVFFHYSERQIQRIIKSRTGMSFSDNIRKLKMGRAAQMLSNTTIPIADISLKLGYSDPARFRHVFKDYYGISPSDYRKIR